MQCRITSESGEMATQEPYEIQKGEVQSPASGEQQPHALTYAEGYPAGKQLSREGPEVPGGHQVE